MTVIRKTEFQITTLIETPAPEFTLSPATPSQCLKNTGFPGGAGARLFAYEKG